MNSYTTIPDDKGGFTVQVGYEIGGMDFSPKFKTKVEAEAWIVARKILVGPT
jgi:hypothetical protein